MWWRVEIDAEGDVVSCKAIAKPSKPSGRVFCVQAYSAKAATREAHNRLARALAKERRADWDRRGLCTRCGKARDLPARKTCARCKELIQGVNDRKAARKRGEIVATPPPPTRQLDPHLETLLEVQAAWMRYQTNRAFSDWLRAEIQRAGGVAGRVA